MDYLGYNLWADGYDKTKGIPDDDGRYPYAGYKEAMNAVYGAVMSRAPARVLDLGPGLGILSAKLYDGGNAITGVEISKWNLDIAKSKMPNARLFPGDYTKSLPKVILNETLDFISKVVMRRIPPPLGMGRKPHAPFRQYCFALL
ncbi:MAG: class I SAM-dependent methyltransferase [Clostridiales bacterium]|nr:class I SAM-dependent methyltransferase [Clostridiales bacterium]